MRLLVSASYRSSYGVILILSGNYICTELHDLPVFFQYSLYFTYLTIVSFLLLVCYHVNATLRVVCPSKVTEYVWRERSC
jgi:hypothetical protein